MTPALGVDLSEPVPRAVLVGADGHVAGRGEGADVAGAARAAAGDLHVDVAGLALFHGESGDAAIAALRGRARRIDPVEAGGAAVVAETWCGAAKGCRHAVCLLIGDRVAAGLLLDGRVWSGARGRAGAAAWLALNPVERQDYRRFGSLAAEVSGKGIARRLSWRIQAGDRSAVLDRAGDLDAITAAHVFEGARSGDGVSISVVRDTAKYIGMAIANLAATVDPEMVVVGGPVAAAGDLLLDAVRQEAGRWLAPDMMDALRIEFSPLGGDAVAIGAARLAMTAA